MLTRRPVTLRRDGELSICLLPVLGAGLTKDAGQGKQVDRWVFFRAVPADGVKPVNGGRQAKKVEQSEGLSACLLAQRESSSA